MPRCAVVNCTFADRKNESVNSFYQIPEDEKLRKTWLALCGRDVERENRWRDLVADTNVNCAVGKLRVCARHFDDTDFDQDLRFQLMGKWYRRRLNSHAVPHLKLATIKEEPIDVEGLSDEASTPSFSLPVIKEVASVNGVDIKWWGKLESCDIDADNQHESNSNVGEHFSDHPPTEQITYVSPPVQVQQQISSDLSIQHAPPSSLPASQTWPGEYEFTVSFSPQEKNTKGVSWTYSKIVDKLYVGKDAPCPINFSANAPLSNDMSIRVMALYTSPEQVSEVVKRCVNHSMQEISAGIIEAEHLIRCESLRATYHEDVSTGRHSVAVPFENPPVGQHYSTYIYKFVCFGSCAGGPNRRPLMLIFTLERGNQVIGRKKVDVKICACPGRDRRAEETQLYESDIRRGGQKRKEPSYELSNLSDTLNFTRSVSYPPTKKSKSIPDKDGCYTINVEDKECYDFLLQMKKFYEICKMMKDLSPDIIKAMLSFHKRKNGDRSE